MNETVQIHSQLEGKKPVSAVLIMVCIYIFLVIERPWESIRYLEGLQIERAYAILLIIVAFLQHKFRIVSSPTNKWVYGLLGLHFILAPFAFRPGFAVEQGVEYAKMVVLYLLMLSVADDEDSLKLLVKAYVFSTILYVSHSLWEYHNGRHFYRMGISRMIGVDANLNDPNSFGASIVLSLPFAYALLKTEASRILRKIYYAHIGLTILCVILTGSRTAFVALMALCLMLVLCQHGKRKIIIFATLLVAIALLWATMPDEKQNRIRTLWNPQAGPANAQESAEGRMAGWKASVKMFQQNPLTGVGAGGKNFIGYRVAHNIDEAGPVALQSHVLYGEVLAELGIGGFILFIGLIVSIVRNTVSTRQLSIKLESKSSFSYILAGSILCCLILLLIFGIGGHNFYRPLWLWLAAWSIIIHGLSNQRITSHQPNHSQLEAGY